MSWKITEVLVNSKSGKPPSEVILYRPISLFTNLNSEKHYNLKQIKRITNMNEKKKSLKLKFFVLKQYYQILQSTLRQMKCSIDKKVNCDYTDYTRMIFQYWKMIFANDTAILAIGKTYV